MKTKVFTLFLLIFSFVVGQEIYASDCLNVRKDWRNVKDGDVKCETYALRSVILKDGVLEVITIGFEKFRVSPRSVLVRIDGKRDGTYVDVYFKYYDWHPSSSYWQEEKFVIYVRKPEQKARYDVLLKNYTAPRDVLPSVVK